jgi:hypothetical protein
LTCNEKADPKPRVEIAMQSLRFNAALALSQTLGGCPDCSSGFGLGATILGGYRRRIASWAQFGAIGGYTFLWQTHDDRFVHPFFAAPEFSAVFLWGENQFDVSFALGIVGGPVAKRRTIAGFIGVMTLLQASWRSPWRFMGKWPMHITLGALAIAPNGEHLLRSSVTFTPGIAVEYDL